MTVSSTFLQEGGTMKTKPVVLIGTGGWEHEVFDRCLYPRSGMGAREQLAVYSRLFDATEVRPTFWDGTLTSRDAREWIEAVSGNRQFVFNVKLHSSFTHKKEINLPLAHRVRGLVQELAKSDRLGALLFQFPYSYTNTSPNRFHLVKLAQLFPGFPIHVEFRHNTWDHPAITGLLSENGLGSVSSDVPATAQLPRFSMRRVGNTAYLRFHGRNEKGWLLNGMDTRYDYLYNTREIRELNRRLAHVAENCTRIMVIFNNTTAGKAVANAFELTALRAGRRIPVPRSTLEAFPYLRDVAENDATMPLIQDMKYREAV